MKYNALVDLYLALRVVLVNNAYAIPTPSIGSEKEMPLNINVQSSFGIVLTL